MEEGKRRALSTPISLTERITTGGLLCITLSPNDYLSLGSSVFIGFNKIRGGQIRLLVSAPQAEKVQRFVFDEDAPQEGEPRERGRI